MTPEQVKERDAMIGQYAPSASSRIVETGVMDEVARRAGL